jgi:hypothetical protein
MSNIPNETIDAIEKSAADKTKAKEIEIKDRFYKYSPNKVAFLDGYENGLIDGATEWAGNARGLLTALNEIANGADFPRVVANKAIAKYNKKEVENG